MAELVLYGADNAEEILRRGDFKKLASANPALAPYGYAAKQAIDAMGLGDEVHAKWVYGQNVGQAYGFVKTGNADLGFVALSQMTERDAHWRVAESLYSTIWQDAVLLQDHSTARSFFNYLKSPPAQQIIRESGYDIGEE